MGMQAVILAAGESSRFWPLSAERHKCLFRIGGRTLLSYTLASLEEAGVDETIIVQSPEGDVADELAHETRMDLTYVVQEEPKGMAHALRQAERHLDGSFFLLTPYRSNAGTFMGQMLERQEETGAGMVLLSKDTGKPWKYGILDTHRDVARGLVEKPAEGEEPSNARVVGMYLLPEDIFDYIDRVEEHEYQFEDALDLYMREDEARIVFTDMEASSIKYPWDLFDVVRELFDGLERDVSEEADVHETAVIDGPVVIEEGAKVYEHAVLRGPCYIGEGCVIGNNAVVRTYSSVEARCVVGANAEVRGSLVQQDTHLHQAFVGDSILGRDVRVGAGTVFANRGARQDGDRGSIPVTLGEKDERIDTGRYRLGAMVGDGVDIGTQANIMPGVQLGPGSFIGPSTAVFKNVGAEQKVYTEFKNTRRQR